MDGLARRAASGYARKKPVRITTQKGNDISVFTLWNLLGNKKVEQLLRKTGINCMYFALSDRSQVIIATTTTVIVSTLHL